MSMTQRIPIHSLVLISYPSFFSVSSLHIVHNGYYSMKSCATKYILDAQESVTCYMNTISQLPLFLHVCHSSHVKLPLASISKYCALCSSTYLDPTLLPHKQSSVNPVSINVYSSKKNSIKPPSQLQKPEPLWLNSTKEPSFLGSFAISDTGKSVGHQK